MVVEYAEEHREPPLPHYAFVCGLCAKNAQKEERETQTTYYNHQCEKLISYELVTVKIRTQCSH
jgi:hypothetical protein